MLDLDTLIAKTNQSYSHVPAKSPSGVEFTLRNPLQLDRAKRDELVAVNERLADAEGEDEQVDAIRSALLVVTDNEAALDELFNAISGNIAAVLTLFRSYNEGTQAGEA